MNSRDDKIIVSVYRQRIRDILNEASDIAGNFEERKSGKSLKKLRELEQEIENIHKEISKLVIKK